jgi:hypothetical protein
MWSSLSQDIAAKLDNNKMDLKKYACQDVNWINRCFTLFPLRRLLLKKGAFLMLPVLPTAGKT